MITTIITILGLMVLEVVQSVDNAIVNAHILQTMSEKARRWFLVWGIFFAVFVVRGILPFLIVWLVSPGITFSGVLSATLGNNDIAKLAMEESAYILLTGGGMFLLLLYLHWLFLEKKDPYFVAEKWVKEQHGVWFFALAAVLLVGVMWILRDHPFGMIAAATGNAVFFILHGFKEIAEREETKIAGASSDIAKLAFLEVLDLSFSIDGVLGAFAFTTNVMLILIGNGLGAFVVRELTIRGIDKISKYKWLKNGAMTSIGALGLIMILDALGVNIPSWLPTVITIGTVGVTFYASHKHLRNKLDPSASG
ncbi:MAG: DUF475 domain-containing protein [bacterium]